MSAPRRADAAAAKPSFPTWPAVRRLGCRAGRLLADSMSPLGWTLAVANVTCMATFFAFGWHEALAFGVAGTAMTFVALMLSLGRTTFDASISLSERRVRTGESVSVRIGVVNAIHMPTASAHASLPIGRARRHYAVPALMPGQSQRIDVRFDAVARARLTVGPLRIRKGDPFGLIRRERRLTEQLTLFIHPATVPLAVPDAGRIRDLEGRADGRLVDDDFEFRGLREYTPGDDARNVHWPSTAKTGTLMIRQYEATCRTDTSLTLAIDPDGYASAEEFELAVSIHASIGVSCLAQDRPIRAHMGDQHTTPRAATTFLDCCSAITPQRCNHAHPTHDARTHCPEASLYVLTVGSLCHADDIRRMTASLPKSASRLVMQAAAGHGPAIRRLPDCILATVGDLNDLPLIMGVAHDT